MDPRLQNTRDIVPACNIWIPAFKKKYTRHCLSILCTVARYHPIPHKSVLFNFDLVKSGALYTLSNIYHYSSLYLFNVAILIAGEKIRSSSTEESPTWRFNTATVQIKIKTTWSSYRVAASRACITTSQSSSKDFRLKSSGRGDMILTCKYFFHPDHQTCITKHTEHVINLQYS